MTSPGVVAPRSAPSPCTREGADLLNSKVPAVDILVNNLGIFEAKPFNETEALKAKSCPPIGQHGRHSRAGPLLELTSERAAAGPTKVGQIHCTVPCWLMCGR